MPENENENLPALLQELRAALVGEGIELDEEATDVEIVNAATEYYRAQAAPLEPGEPLVDEREELVKKLDRDFATARTNMGKREWIDKQLVDSGGRVMYLRERKMLGLVE